MRKLCLLGGILIAAVFALSGCGSKGNPNELKVMWWGDVYNSAFAQKLIDAFMAENPDIPVKLIGVQGGYAGKLLSMAASHTLPDVVLLVNKDAYNLGTRGALLPLNKYTETPEYVARQKDMWPGLMESLAFNDQQLAVPIWTWTPGVYYNKDMFDAAGVQYPSPNWTFKEFEEKSRKLLKKENGKTSVFAVTMSFNLLDMMLRSYLYSYGGSIYNADMTKCTLNDPASLAALQKFIDLKIKDGISPTDAQSTSLVSGNEDVFQGGKVAMRVAGRDFMDVLRQKGGAKFNWAAAPMPAGPKKSFFQVAAAVGISAHTKNPEAAWKFVSFVSGEKGQRLVTAERSDVTIFKSLAYDKAFMNYQGRPDVNAVFRDMLLEAKPNPYKPGEEEWMERSRNILARVELKQISVQAACKEIVDSFVP